MPFDRFKLGNKASHNLTFTVSDKSSLIASVTVCYNLLCFKEVGSYVDSYFWNRFATLGVRSCANTHHPGCPGIAAAHFTSRSKHFQFCRVFCMSFDFVVFRQHAFQPRSVLVTPCPQCYLTLASDIVPENWHDNLHHHLITIVFKFLHHMFRILTCDKTSVLIWIFWYNNWKLL